MISPGGVGYDINCGVRLHTTELAAEEVLDELPAVIKALYNTIPSGVGKSRKDLGRSKKELIGVLSEGAGWAVKKGARRRHRPRTYRRRRVSSCRPRGPVAQGAGAGVGGQVGTLGSGNHFIEIGHVVELHDEEAAAAFGLFKGQLTVLLHSGSRGLGYQVCDDSIRVMMRAARKYGIDLPDRQLCCAPLGSQEAESYFKAMGAAANFAFANRQVMGHEVGEVLGEVLHLGPRDLGYRLVYDVCHNIAKKELHTVDGKEVELCVHRKGATRALPAGDPRVPGRYRHVGQPVLVPGDLGTSSYVLVGQPAARELTFCSCCHGAGRVSSRKKSAPRLQGPLSLQGALRQRHHRPSRQPPHSGRRDARGL